MEKKSDQGLDILSGRVAMLEKLVVELAKWIQFDLNTFAGRQMDDDNDDDDYYVKKIFRSEKRSNTRPSTLHNVTSTENKKSITGRRHVASKSPTSRKLTARKSTAGGSRKNALSSGQDNLSPPSHPKLELVTIMPDKDIKTEPVHVEYENFVKVEKSDNDGDYYFVPQGSDLDSDDSFNQNVKDKKRKQRTNIKTEISKAPQSHPGKPRFRYYAPLRVIPSTVTKDLNPVIKLDNLTLRELEQMSIKVPPPRRTLLRGPHKCPNCDTILHTRRKWEAHQRKFHTEKKTSKTKIQCSYCPKSFRHKSRFLIHERGHTKEKPFLCFRCGHTSKTLQMLNSHISLIHPNVPREKRFKCDQCERRFLSQAGLYKHVKKEHGADGKNELAVQCHLCTVVVSDSGKLKRHIADIHENRRTLACHLCGQLFKRPQHLKKHIIRHDNPHRRRRGEQKPVLRKGTVLLPKAEDVVEHGNISGGNVSSLRLLVMEEDQAPAPSKEVTVITTTLATLKTPEEEEEYVQYHHRHLHGGDQEEGELFISGNLDSRPQEDRIIVEQQLLLQVETLADLQQ